MTPERGVSAGALSIVLVGLTLTGKA